MTGAEPRVTGVLSDSDALLWTIGRDPVLRPTIVAVAMFDRPPPWVELVNRVEELTARVPALRSLVVSPAVGMGKLRWVEDPSFELGLHLGHQLAPPPATLRTVLDLAEHLATTAFDPQLPPWEAVLVGGLDGGGAALILKVHHAIVDGVGGISLVQQLLDDHAARTPHVDAAHFEAGPSGTALLSGALSGAARWAGRALPIARRVTLHLDESIRQAGATALSAARLLEPAPTPLSPLLRGRGIHRHFEVLDPSYDGLRHAAERAGGTVNDAFVAAVLGGLCRYHKHHGTSVAALRMTMPVSVRRDTDPAMGNRFVPARFEIPLSSPDPMTRVRAVHDIAGSWKHAPGLRLTELMAVVLDRLPPAVTTAAFGSMLKGADFVATNVPGPPAESFLAGCRLGRFYAFAPTSGAAMNVALVTLAGRSCIGISIDTAAVVDGEVLRECLAGGFEEVLEALPTRGGDERADAGGEG
jgi:WS/DGAT/MGAT family acyltransferase